MPCSYSQSSTFSINLSVDLSNLLHSNSHLLPNGNVITTTYNQTNGSSYITMFNSNGIQQWSKEYGSTRIDDIHVLDNGNIAFAGYFSIYNSIWGLLDASGNQIWAKKLYSYDFNYDLATVDVLASGKLLFGFSKYTRNVTVRCDENGNTEDCDEGEDTLGNGKSPRFDIASCDDSGYVGSCKSDDRIMIIRHDANGNVMWAKNYMKVNTDYFHMKKIQQLSDGSFISIGLVSDSYSGPNNFGFILKINGNGDIIWAKKYFLPGNAGYFSSTFRSLEVTSSEMYVGGYYSPDHITMNNFIMKLDLNGNVIWAKQILQTNSESMGAPIPTMGNVSFEQEIKNGTFIYNNYYTDWNGYIIELNKVDVNGELGCFVSDLATTAIPYTGFASTIPAQYGQVSILDSDPGLITDQALVVNNTSLNTSNSCAAIAGVEDQSGLGISTYPNPVVEVLNIQQLNESDNYCLKLFNASGQIIRSITNVNGVANYTLAVQDLNAGTYVLLITETNKGVSQSIKWVKL